MKLQEYINEIQGITKKSATEHTYRTALENLFNSISLKTKKIEVIHEESNKEYDGTPDFSIYENANDLFKKLVGFIECKKISYNLDKLISSAQIKKYAKSSSNIIITNYKEFILLQKKDNQLVEKHIINLLNGKEKVELESDFNNMILDFFKYEYSYIRTKKQLINELSTQSFIVSQNMRKIVEKGLDVAYAQTIKKLFDEYSGTLHYSYTKADFCDIYAQSLVYSLLISRLEDPELKFNEDKSNYIQYIPRKFKILREFLENGYNNYTPIKVKSILQQVAKQINLIDIKTIEKEFDRQTDGRNSIIVYLYEEFLQAYDKLKATENRKENGVYYTPREAVDFIVKSTNEIIKYDLGRKKGFLDDGVKVLDFATGTGSFLDSVIEQMTAKITDSISKKEIKEKILNNVYGFELLFTPYLVAHIVLTKHLEEKGIKLNEDERLGIYLTNTLDLEESLETQMLYLNNENEKVDKIKKEENILAIVGNPPYFNGKSGNSSKVILNLIKDYKKDLDERKINLDDLYIQFIRLAEYKINQNDSGVVGIITNNSFLDGITHRQMRKHLLSSFDEIYVLNLHGNTRKGETDKNIFDIMVGVNITFFVKNPKAKEKAIYYNSTKDMKLTSRKEKLNFLSKNTIKTLDWKKLKIDKKNHWFVEKDFKNQKTYDSFWKITDIFETRSLGILTQNDSMCIKYKKEEVKKLQEDLVKLDNNEVMEKYNFKDTKRDWKLEKAKMDIKEKLNTISYSFRAWDYRYTHFSRKGGIIAYNRYNATSNIVNKNNIVLVFERGMNKFFHHIFITDNSPDHHCIGAGSYIAPLYLYENEEELLKNNTENKITNFTKKFNEYLAGLGFSPSPEEIMAYIYGVMHSPIYRKKYLEFLKVDFPAVPMTKNKTVFYKYAKLGRRLTDLHLLKEDLEDKDIKAIFNDNLDSFIIEKIIKPTNTDDLLTLKTNNGDIQFKGVSSDIYSFEIGSYKPIDKWIKYRIKDKVELDLQAIKHIKNMVISIKQTMKIMSELEKLKEEYLEK